MSQQPAKEIWDMEEFWSDKWLRKITSSFSKVVEEPKCLFDAIDNNISMSISCPCVKCTMR